jgi:hypothetical protein
VVAVICALLLGGAIVLGLVSRVDGGLRVAGVTTPEICLMKRSTGIPCPGCGLTRSWILAAQGRPGASFHQHRLGLVLMAWVALEGSLRGVWLAVGRARTLLDRMLPWVDRLAIPIAVAMLVNWGFVLAAR